MKAETVEQRLRRFLMWVIVFIFIGTVFELILLEHYLEPLQIIPYVLSGLGIAALMAVWLKSNRKTILTLRWIMAAVGAGSLLGIYFHFTANLEFTRSINPTFTFIESLWPAMKGGKPLLAPAILFLAGVLGIGVTYKHPVLKEA